MNDSNENHTRDFPKSTLAETPAPRRINPWRMFTGSMVPNWLQCRSEISQGAKLAYARLAQYSGKAGDCFPKQETLGLQLGVSERTANEYIRTLVKFRLIEKQRRGLCKPNRYYFLDHPWMHDGQLKNAYGHKSLKSSTPVQQIISGKDQQPISVPIIKENQKGRETGHTPRDYLRYS